MLKSRKLTLNQFIVYAAIFGSLGAILNLFQVPYPPVPFLRFDLSEVVVLIAAVISFPLAICVAILKALILFVTGLSSDPIGVISLIIGSVTLAITFKVATYFKLNVLVSSILSGIVFVIVMLLSNYLFILPLYNGLSFSELSAQGNYLTTTIATYLPFNLIKMIIDIVAFNFLYSVLKKV